MKARLQLLSHFLKDPKSTGTIWPSSSSLARDIRAQVEAIKALHPDAVIVEAGPGTGAITKHIFDLSTPFYAIERNQELIATLKQTCPQVTVIQADLQHTQIFEEISAPIIVVSSLPVLSLDSKREIVALFEKLLLSRKAVALIQFTYGVRDPIRFGRPEIQSERKKITFNNLPPACVWLYTLRA